MTFCQISLFMWKVNDIYKLTFTLDDCFRGHVLSFVVLFPQESIVFRFSQLYLILLLSSLSLLHFGMFFSFFVFLIIPFSLFSFYYGNSSACTNSCRTCFDHRFSCFKISHSTRSFHPDLWTYRFTH